MKQATRPPGIVIEGIVGDAQQALCRPGTVRGLAHEHRCELAGQVDHAV
jgi:hypothetical protein